MKPEIGLNRMLFPRADLRDFFDMTVAVGVRAVELRNDLPGKGIVDDLSVNEVVDLAGQKAIRIETINALQQFNLPSHRDAAAAELDGLMEVASSIGCGAIVFCPNNQYEDARNPEEMYDDTVASLESFARQLGGSGMKGYIEPLGFRQSSLRSIREAARAIAEAGAPDYKLVYDTFHHYLGPDTSEWIEAELDVSSVGVVHASGVPSSVTTDELLDEHRELIDSRDKLGNVEQIALLRRLTYDGVVSLEPFSPALSSLAKERLEGVVRECVEFLRE